MTIYPAIDIKEGRAVRLRQGEMKQVTDYGDPCAAALKWQESGAEYIHLVDLDGAIDGMGSNLAAIHEIVHAVHVPVQLGGGIRTLDDMEIRLDEVGVKRVILGTVATTDPAIVKEACRRWPGRIVLGLDVRKGAIAVKGWVENSALKPEDVIYSMRDAGIETIIFTDIGRDGMMNGPNVEVTKQMVASSGMQVIASGGISTLDDIRAVRAAGCQGVIIGKALYTGAIDLVDALQINLEKVV